MIPYPAKVPYDYESRKKYIDVPFPDIEYRERLKAIRKMLQAHELSGLLVYSFPVSDDGVGHLSYLSGFRALGGDGVLLLPRDGDPTLIFDRIFTEPIASCIWTTWIKDVWPSTRENIPLNIQSWIKENNLENARIGLVGEHMLPWDLWNQTQRDLPTITWIPVTQAFNDIQKMKSDREMQLIRKVCQMTNEGMRAGVEAIVPGISEGEIIGKINAEFFVQGAHDLSFTSVIASGPRGGIKHSYPTMRKIKKGDIVYIDVGARYYGYHTDMSRVVIVGTPTNKQKEILGYVKDAYYTLLDTMNPGVPVTEISAVAQNLETESGIYRKYGKEGVYVRLAASHAMSNGLVEWSLQDGRTVISPNLSPLAFEPMIVIQNFGTIVIESMVGFTQKGANVLTPLKLDWM